MPPRFVHLHTHSHYSLLSALPQIPDLVSAAKEAGMRALALTDNANLYGAIEFYKECLKQGIKPIIGVDLYVAARTRNDKEPKIDAKRTRLVLLAENLAGYRNLLKLVTRANLEGFYYRPRVDHELLAEHADGLIAIIPSLSSETSDALRAGDRAKAVEIVSWYRNTFGTGDVFLEITNHPEIEGYDTLRPRVIELSAETGVPLVAAHDVYYLSPDDKRARETLVRIQTGVSFSERGFDEKGADFSFISSDAAEEYFRDVPEALANTVTISERCTLELKLGSWVFPNIEAGGYKTHDDALRALAENGIAKRGLTDTPEVRERMEYELGIIKTKGYAPYFLVVADLLNFAHEKHILTTIRGSVAGSLVTYLAGITNVDPLAYKLPFERFLNPERPSAPDIDMDFADNRRDEMIDYARAKYSASHVAQIGTFGTMMARAAVRDVARALGHPYGVGDKIAKLIPFGSQGFPMTIDHALEITPELASLYKKEKDAREVIDLAKKIEGCARHISVHAAGVVISPSDLTNFVPLQFDPKGGKLITQYDMYAVEEAGLLKFDFLGIRNLAILADSVARVKAHYGTTVDIENIPVDDATTFAMLAKGETMGLFQLNGSGMTRYLKELKPSTIHDINAMVALYRPGPMETIPQYIERKHTPHLVTYLDSRMREYLETSHGLLVYQDDVLLTSIKLAGYSWLEADKLRKAMGKKIPEVMQAEKEKLLKGFVEYGKLSPKLAEQLWKLIEPFAAYGFNKAHAASYGKVAYQTAYMKAHYPAEYMAALLTAEAGDLEMVAEAIGECARLGIPVLPPDVNESASAFTVVSGKDSTDAIRFGLRSIKNFGEGVAGTIIAEREKGGRFTSIEGFLERIRDKNLNKKSLESLIMCGALDELGERGVLLANMERLLSYHKEASQVSENQDSLFGALPVSNASLISLAPAEPASQKTRLVWEKDLLGLYVSGHPLDAFREKLEKQSASIKRVKEETREGVTTVVFGIVEESRPILTKGGEKMAFVKLADLADSIEVVVFPRLYAVHSKLFEAEKCISIKGRMSGRNGVPSIVAEAVKEL